MKKTILSVLGLCVLLFVSCETPEDESLSAPDMGSPSALRDFTGALPANAAESKALFLNAKNALDAAMDAALNPEQTPAGMVPKGTFQDTFVNEVFPVGGGTVTLNGTVSETFPDFPQSYSPNTAYPFPFNLKFDFTGVISNVTVPVSGSPTYTIYGKYVAKIDMDGTIRITTDSAGNPASITVDLDMTMQEGLALTVESAGKGAKFIVSFPFEYSIENAPANMEGMPNDLISKLQNTRATLRVYNNEDQEIHRVELTLLELGADL